MTDLEEARLEWRPKVLPASSPAGAARPPAGAAAAAQGRDRGAPLPPLGPGGERESRLRGLHPAQRRQAPRVPCIYGQPTMCLTFDDIPLFGILVFVQRKMGLITRPGPDLSASHHFLKLLYVFFYNKK